jgi:hypothetical protein
MTQDLFRHAGRPKELWVVEGAKHNQALQVAGDEYKRRVTDFFDRHLADGKSQIPSTKSETTPNH